MNIIDKYDLSVVVVTYNSRDVIKPCLDSVLNSRNVNQHAVVVDNASPDNTAAVISSDYRDICLLNNKDNLGFAAACNQALRHCKGKYVLFLNPDTELTPDTLSQAIGYMEANSSVGLAGCRISSPDGIMQDSVSYKYPGQKFASRELQGLPGSIACVLGAAMIARLDLIKKLNGFDEDFFLYGEDQDLCLRVRKAKWSIGFISAATVIHIGGHSEQGFPASDVWIKKINAELLFQRKHYSAEAAGRIRRANLLRCRLRLLWVSISKALGDAGKDTDAKIIKYHTIRSALLAALQGQSSRQS